MKNQGIRYLRAKTAGIIAAAIGVISPAMGAALIADSKKDSTTPDEFRLQKPKLIPKLVLKLNVSNSGNDHLLAMHASHSSHSSHYSGSSSGHSSHSSHASHYSSSSYESGSSYTAPSYSPPTYSKPSTPAQHNTTPKKSHVSNNNRKEVTGDTLYTLGERVLHKGCKGKDVSALQQKLSSLGYNVIVTGFFGAKTESAVKSIQMAHAVTADGIVGAYTLEIIENRL